VKASFAPSLALPYLALFLISLAIEQTVFEKTWMLLTALFHARESHKKRKTGSEITFYVNAKCTGHISICILL